jgi:hypothetical protein
MVAFTFRRGSSARVAWHAAAFLAALGALSRDVHATEGVPEFVGNVDPFVKAAVTRAFAIALEQLGRTRCLQVFSEFNDGTGRSLTENLEALNLTASRQLTSIRVADGAHEKTCADPGVLAFTHPGASTIYVCGHRFAALTRMNPRLAAALILHEQLHSLGLGENPPESREITGSVLRSCGN